MKKTQSKYINCEAAAPSRRIFCALLDKFFVVILTVLMGVIAVNFILPSIPEVKASQDRTEALYVECLHEYEASKLRGVDYTNLPGNLENIDITFKNYAKRHIDGSVNESNDNFAYFYLTYRSEHNMGKTEEYNLSYMNKEVFGLPTAPSDYTGTIWSYTSIDQFVTFNDTVKKDLSDYFDGNVNEQTQKTYNNVFAEFEKIFTKANTEFTTNKNSGFYSKYIAYSTEGYTFINYGVITILICFTLSFAVLYIPISMANKGGRTFGKFIFKLALVNKDDTNLLWPQKLLRIGIQFTESLWTLFIICGFFSSAMISNPIFTVGGFKFSLLWVILMSSLVEIVSIVLLMMHKEKVPLHDLIFKTKVVDITTMIEPISPKFTSDDVDEEIGDEWSLDNYKKDDAITVDVVEENNKETK